MLRLEGGCARCTDVATLGMPETSASERNPHDLS